MIRQRCGCKGLSTYAESSSAPNPRRHIEDVHYVGVAAPDCRARHEARAHTINTAHSPILKHSPSQSRPHAGHRQSTQQHALEPPAKIATPTFGSDVAARSDRASLRFAVLQTPDVTLKMSTALEKTPLSAAQGMRLAHAISEPTSAHSTIRFPNPHNSTRKDTKKQP